MDLSELDYTDLLQLGITIPKTIMKNIGIPVTVGIAPTKTLAKMANRYAKKFKETGVFYAEDEKRINEMLSVTEVDDVWGVGKQYPEHEMLAKTHNVIADFRTKPWIKAMLEDIMSKYF